MNTRASHRYPALAAFVAAVIGSIASAAPPAFDTKAIDQAMGRSGDYIEAEGVYKFSKPRKDLTVRVGDWTVPGFMGIGSWAAFAGGNGHVMVMGDNALLEDEVGPAMQAALDNGLAVTGLHNHFFFDQPRVFFMHVEGSGDPAMLAVGVRKVFEVPDRVRTASSSPAHRFDGLAIGSQSRISGEPLQRILGYPGQANEGMYKVTIGRVSEMDGMPIGKEMGVNTWAAFAGTDDAAVVDGDFAMHDDELQQVLKALLANGIHVVAIHQHMAGEQPRMLFLHYWGQGRAADLARGVKAALDVTRTASEQRSLPVARN